MLGVAAVCCSDWFGLFALHTLGLPIIAGAEHIGADAAVVHGRDLGNEVQVVVRVPPLDGNALGRCWDDIPVQVNVDLAGFDSLQQDLHELGPLLDFAGLRLSLIQRSHGAIPGFLPRLAQLDPLGEGERLATTTTNEQPAAPAPRAIHLPRRRDESVSLRALAVAYEIIIRLPQVDVLRHGTPSMAEPLTGQLRGDFPPAGFGGQAGEF